MIVVDSNVLAYLLVSGSRTAEAEAVFRKDPLWIAPRLWRSELLNTLTTYVRRGDLDVDKAVAIVDKATKIVSDALTESNSKKVIEASKASGCSGYDCEYVTLAIETKVLLVTADNKVLQSFPAIARSMSDFIK